MTDDADIWLRRERLETRRNPYPRIDYVVTVDGMINLAGRESLDDRAYTVSVTVRYVPDKLTVTPDSLTGYLGHLSDGRWGALEDLAAVMLEDINNEVVPRWVLVTLTTRASGLSYGHVVSMEDQQPKWKNPRLMERLVRI